MRLNRTASSDPLAALGARLSAYGLGVELTERGLRVSTSVEVVGCGYGSACARDTITCRSRPEDGGRAWFWDGARDPITPVEEIENATWVVRVRLGGRRTAAAGVKR